ncbi:MAG: DUF952 domain-containing protein [Alphaproteobacteria bacterium]|nr:DUF952 domain-containing protein [Alphaproteobacteria bacterium]
MTRFVTASTPRNYESKLSNPTVDKSTTVYKLLDRSDWEGAVESGAFAGSADDIRDGFIHLSAAHQLAGTAAKYFRGRSDLVLVGFQCSDLGDALKWEASRGGDLFPHLYAALPAKAAASVHQLELDGDGLPVLPEGLS